MYMIRTHGRGSYVGMAPGSIRGRGFPRASKTDNQPLPLLARSHIFIQKRHDGYVHTTYTSLHSAVLVE